MQYGCIGEKLSHSFSKLIHARLYDASYELCELTPEGVEPFLKTADFCAVNVTIPYKQTVIPFLDEIDPVAASIGAVNTIVNRDGKLYGYNTDFYGLCSLLQRENISLCGKKVLILGTGGTSKTAFAVAKEMGAEEIFRVSRTERTGCITYERALTETDTQIIINTTPAGMFPALAGQAIDLAPFKRLEAVVDVVYNPLRTSLMLAARKRGIKAVGGLYMLVAQAVKAAEYFLDRPIEKEKTEEIYKALYRERENIVLIGMPASGKSTVGALLAQKTGRKMYDTDTLVEEASGKTVAEMFATEGERAFRDAESEKVNSLAACQGLVIATGGGAVLRAENVDALRHNGRLYFIDRPLAELLPTDSRPLASDRNAIEQRYRERYELYCRTADCRVWRAGGAEAVAQMIYEDFMK